MIEAPTRFGFKRLLLGTDFSPRADVALQRAVQIASEHGAALTLFHACDVGARDDAQGRKLIVGAEETARQKIRSLSLPDKIAAAVRVAAGKPFVELIHAAREEESDLVVVGAHGKHFLKSLLLGTTAEKVVRKGDRPVLVVKRATRRPYRQVLVPVDFSEDSRQGLALALRLAPRAKFHVLHAYEGSEGQLWRADFKRSEIMQYRRRLAQERRKELEEFLRRANCGGKPIKRLLRHGRAPHVIAGVAGRLRADLVSVGTVGRTGLPYILLGSVAEHVMREASCDVLVARSGPSRFQLP
jgi:nucleotide-binding universal stress UspA family protein